jgi:mannan endo-1,4-beta-mannosidase
VISLPRRRSRVGLLAALLSACLLGLTACGGSTGGTGQAAGDPGGSSSAAAPGGAGSTPYDISPLLAPSHKYLGAALNGVPASMAPVTKYAAETGKSPNVLEYYASWGDGFNASGVRKIDDSGALAYMTWEPFKPSLAKIASGASDAYITSFAKSVRTLNLPLAISFGHEMNGTWYPWGTKGNSAKSFVAAWRHIHDLFDQAGATNVIWVWSPNVINPVPKIKLKPYYPGDAYVDWVGMVGYYTVTGERTFDALYGPTMRQVEGFTKKPFFISETASQEGQRRKADVDDLFTGVATHSNVLGFVWFDISKRADWRIEVSPIALSEFKQRASSSLFGFDVRHP